ncbi:MAG: YibE/F family protein, partial [Chlorobiales bacterium]|nr:YibE/F family protein [Chlorobiales bacterium]
FYSLRLTDIFLSGIFISSAGAVMAMAMDIAASQAEVVEKNPGINRKDLIVSGFRVGQAVIGTMTTTLLFAYSGSFTFVLMVFMAQGTPMEYIFNISYVAAEILLTLVGSFGLVLVAPVTAVLGGLIYTARQGKTTPK